jgi:LEA14-like dessication related protein
MSTTFKPGGVPAFIFLIGFVAALLCSCGKMEVPEFRHIENVRIKNLGLKSSVMIFDMNCFNPNKRGARLKQAEGDAWIDSAYVGHFIVDTLVNIPGKSDFIVPVKLDVDMKYFARYSLFGFRNEESLIKIKGRAKVGKGGIYKKIPLQYEGRQNLGRLVR